MDAPPPSALLWSCSGLWDSQALPLRLLLSVMPRPFRLPSVDAGVAVPGAVSLLPPGPPGMFSPTNAASTAACESYISDLGFSRETETEPVGCVFI